jgi:hypothetical protein
MESLDEDIDFVEGHSYTFNFPLSRFLENTPSEITQKLMPVTNSSLAFLEDTPTLYVSELFREKIDGEFSKFIKIISGKVKDLTVSDKKIHYTFIPEQIFGKLMVLNEEKLSIALGVNNSVFGLTRTHWAIKDTDLSFAMQRIEDSIAWIYEIPHIESSTFKYFDNTNAEPDPIDSLQEYIRLILEMESEDGIETFYRGHSDQRYLLEPSILRKYNDSGEYIHYFSEKELSSELLTMQPAEFHSDKSMLDKLVRMQHFGLPTRLLDLTYNPLVALYFACERHPEINGEVIILKTSRSAVKFYDSDTVSCITNLSRLDHEQKNELSKCIDDYYKYVTLTDSEPDIIDNASNDEFKNAIAEFNAEDVCGHLLHSIKEEKPYFKNIINPEDLSRVLFVRGRMSNMRISSQSGAFLLYGLDAVLQEAGDRDVIISRIVIGNKAGILKQLHTLNIHASTIYPGLEKSAEEIKIKYQSRRS